MSIESVRTWDKEADVYGGRRPQGQWKLPLGQRGEWRLGEDGKLEFLPGILSMAMPILNKVMGGKTRRPVYIPPPVPPTPTYVYVLGGAGALTLLGLLGYLAFKK